MQINKKTIKLDHVNKRILGLIHKEANLSNQEMAERIGLSPSACFQRKKALQEAGYFFNFHTEMDLDRICVHVLAYVEFWLESNTGQAKQSFEEAISKNPFFMDCIRVGGTGNDYVSFTCFPDIKTMQQTCDELGSNQSLGITRLEIRPILERTKWYLGYPLEKLKWLD